MLDDKYASQPLSDRSYLLPESGRFIQTAVHFKLCCVRGIHPERCLAEVRSPMSRSRRSDFVLSSRITTGFSMPPALIDRRI